MKMAPSLYEKLVRTSLYVRVCATRGSVRTGLYTRVCTYRSVRTKLYVQACTRKHVRAHGAMAGQVAIHKAGICCFSLIPPSKTHRYVHGPVVAFFPGYIDENAIQNNFQRVPPLLDGSVCEFPDIAVEMGFALKPTCKHL